MSMEHQSPIPDYIPVVLNPVYGEHVNPLYVELSVVDGIMVNRQSLTEVARKKIEKSGVILEIPPNMKTFCGDKGLEVGKYVIYDTDTDQLTQVSEDEYNFINKL